MFIDLEFDEFARCPLLFCGVRGLLHSNPFLPPRFPVCSSSAVNWIAQQEVVQALLEIPFWDIHLMTSSINCPSGIAGVPFQPIPEPV